MFISSSLCLSFLFQGLFSIWAYEKWFDSVVFVSFVPIFSSEFFPYSKLCSTSFFVHSVVCSNGNSIFSLFCKCSGLANPSSTLSASLICYPRSAAADANDRITGKCKGLNNDGYSFLFRTKDLLKLRVPIALALKNY